MAACAAQVAPGGVAIGLMGDTPYTEREVQRLDQLIDEINADSLAFIVHVGDIGSPRQACTDEWLAARKRQFARIRHPFVLLPGDNEWTDCRNQVERLDAWRRIFCETALKVEKQSGPFCEHLRWEFDGLVFVTLNVPGTNNNVGRPEEFGPRMQAVYAWLDEAARVAESRKGLVLLMQANPFISLPRDGYRELRENLIHLGQKMPGRVVLVHGDTHTWHDDEPLPGVRRIEVWGSPIVSWLKLPLSDGVLGTSAPRHR
ncbi:MAG TPA: metallophosphoesterase [Burkholderiales bacterium]